MTAIDLVLYEAYNVNWKQSTMLKTRKLIHNLS